MILFSVLICI